MSCRTGREGPGSAVGHDLTIEVLDWSVQIGVPETGPTDATAVARVELRPLAVQAGTGGAAPLAGKDRGDIENNARRKPDVGRHPAATFQSTRVVAGGDRATVSGDPTLHGVTGPMDVDVREVAPDRYRATTVVSRSAYGDQAVLGVSGGQSRSGTASKVRSGSTSAGDPWLARPRAAAA